MSVLLRQPHGFEGFLPPREATEPDAPAVANGEHMSDRLFKWHRTALQLTVLMNEDQDAVIVQFCGRAATGTKSSFRDLRERMQLKRRSSWFAR